MNLLNELKKLLVKYIGHFFFQKSHLFPNGKDFLDELYLNIDE